MGFQLATFPQETLVSQWIESILRQQKLKQHLPEMGPLEWESSEPQKTLVQQPPDMGDHLLSDMYWQLPPEMNRWFFDSLWSILTGKQYVLSHLLRNHQFVWVQMSNINHTNTNSLKRVTRPTYTMTGGPVSLSWQPKTTISWTSALVEHVDLSILDTKNWRNVVMANFTETNLKNKHQLL